MYPYAVPVLLEGSLYPVLQTIIVEALVPGVAHPVLRLLLLGPALLPLPLH